MSTTLYTLYMFWRNSSGMRRSFVYLTITAIVVQYVRILYCRHVPVLRIVVECLVAITIVTISILIFHFYQPIFHITSFLIFVTTSGTTRTSNLFCRAITVGTSIFGIATISNYMGDTRWTLLLSSSRNNRQAKFTSETIIIYHQHLQSW